MKFMIGYMARLMYVVFGLLLFQAGLQAHTDEILDAEGGVHGGMMRMSGPYHLELVVNDGKAVVWVMDHGNQPQRTQGAQGQLVLFQEDGRVVLDLDPHDESTLRAMDSRIRATDSPRAMLTLSMKGQSPIQVRFAELSKPESQLDSHENHAH